MADNLNVHSDKNLSPSDSRMKLGPISVPSLKIKHGEIYEEARKELQFPYCIDIYRQMEIEPSISSAIGLLKILLSRSKWTVKAPAKASEEERQRAEFINWSMANMSRPWPEYIIEFLGYLTYGHQPLDKIYHKIKEGEHKGRVAIKDFRSISPTTIRRWIYDKDTGELRGLRQDLSLISSDFSTSKQLGASGVHNDIPRKKFINFRFESTNNNPQGKSPLRSCYIPWKQKSVVEDYELIGVGRDLGGTPVVGVDLDFLSRASDKESEEYKTLMELHRQAANLHAGEQAYVMKPLAYDDRGNSLFSFDLIGVNGGGKSYDPDVIIKRNDNKMLMAFLADVLKLGTESHGSFALADSKTGLLAKGVEHHLKIIKDTLDHDLVRQIYALNGWGYNQGTSAEFSYGDIEKKDLDVLGKFVQRTVSVGAIRPSKELEEHLLENIDVEASDEMELLDTKSTSRAGESNGTSGTGSTQDSGGASDSNNDNAS